MVAGELLKHRYAFLQEFRPSRTVLIAISRILSRPGA